MNNKGQHHHKVQARRAAAAISTSTLMPSSEPTPPILNHQSKSQSTAPLRPPALDPSRPATTTQLKSNSNDSELSPTTKLSDKLLSNEMSSFRNRGFHDGYDKGKQSIIQESFDTGYKKAFERNFILSTLKGVANALNPSKDLNNKFTNSNNVVYVKISSSHLSLLESMKFDGSTDIETLKNDLIRICRENRLEILAHYVSQIG